MGQIHSRFKNVFGDKEMRILMTGLNAVGKSTILNKLNMGIPIRSISTNGFNVDTVAYNNVSFAVWDMDNQDDTRPLWKQYYQNTQAVIFVVDSNDHERVGEAREELHRLLSEDELSEALLLVFAIKQDLPSAMNASRISEELGLHDINCNRNWHIQGTCATIEDGLFEEIDWLAHELRSKKED